MLTIFKKDGSSQVIQVDKEFYKSERIHKGKEKGVLTPLDKSRTVGIHVSTLSNGNSLYSGFSLKWPDEKESQEGVAHTNTATPKFKNDANLIKQAKASFKKAIKIKYPELFAEGYTIDSIWNAYSTKGLLASSSTQSL